MRKDVWAVTSVLGVALGLLAAPSIAAPVIGSGGGGAKAAISEMATLDLVRNGGGRHMGGRGGGHISGRGVGHVRWHGGGSFYRHRRPYYSYSYGPRYYTSSCWYDASGVRICPRGYYGPRYYYYGGRGYRAHGYVSGGRRPGGHRPGGHRPGGGHPR